MTTHETDPYMPPWAQSSLSAKLPISQPEPITKPEPTVQYLLELLRADIKVLKKDIEDIKGIVWGLRR